MGRYVGPFEGIISQLAPIISCSVVCILKNELLVHSPERVSPYDRRRHFHPESGLNKMTVVQRMIDNMRFDMSHIHSFTDDKAI